ncbi:YgaP-like transmembrane domain [Haloplanus litoreus]|uniref:YgaP-like transmembrane domain n=1 Tax=Haloplanus litoreus TaxID=767515 RepID=A0ABD5ZZE0_9EURY
MVEKNVGGRDRLVRTLLAALLTVVSIRAFERGKRAIGLLAAAGALGFGLNAVTCFCGVNEALGIDTSRD